MLTQRSLCLTSSPLFAPYCIPLLLEKLSSNIVDTKLVCLQTLVVCARAYRDAIAPFLEDIWSSLRTEILNSKEKTVVDAALTTLHDITSTLSQTTLEQFMQPLMTQSLHELHSPDAKIVQSFSKILQEVASASGKHRLHHYLPISCFMYGCYKWDNNIYHERVQRWK